MRGEEVTSFKNFGWEGGGEICSNHQKAICA